MDGLNDGPYTENNDMPYFDHTLFNSKFSEHLLSTVLYFYTVAVCYVNWDHLNYNISWKYTVFVRVSLLDILCIMKAYVRKIRRSGQTFK